MGAHRSLIAGYDWSNGLAPSYNSPISVEREQHPIICRAMTQRTNNKQEELCMKNKAVIQLGRTPTLILADCARFAKRRGDLL